jgi:hypothetical protein
MTASIARAEKKCGTGADCNGDAQRFRDLLRARALLLGGVNMRRDTPIALTGHPHRDCDEFACLRIEVCGLVSGIA